MKLRSIPPRTCITLARKQLIHKPNFHGGLVSKPLTKERCKMRQQISRKPFEDKLAEWQEEIEELSQWAGEGFDISEVKRSLEERIKGLLNLLEGN